MAEEPLTAKAVKKLPKKALEALYPKLLAGIRKTLLANNLAVDVESIKFRPGKIKRVVATRPRTRSLTGITRGIGGAPARGIVLSVQVSPCESWQHEETVCSYEPDGTLTCVTKCLPEKQAI